MHKQNTIVEGMQRINCMAINVMNSMSETTPETAARVFNTNTDVVQLVRKLNTAQITRLTNIFRQPLVNLRDRRDLWKKLMFQEVDYQDADAQNIKELLSVVRRLNMVTLNVVRDIAMQNQALAAAQYNVATDVVEDIQRLKYDDIYDIVMTLREPLVQIRDSLRTWRMLINSDLTSKHHVQLISDHMRMTSLTALTTSRSVAVPAN